MKHISQEPKHSFTKLYNKEQNNSCIGEKKIRIKKHQQDLIKKGLSLEKQCFLTDVQTSESYARVNATL